MVKPLRSIASLVQRGYFAALTNYGWMLNNGHGVPKNQKEAVRLYLLAAQQGDNFGMFNTAMAYDSGEGLPYNPAQAAHWIYAALRLGHGYSIEQMSNSANGWTRDFRVELQRLLKRAGAYDGPADGNFGPDDGARGSHGADIAVRAEARRRGAEAAVRSEIHSGEFPAASLMAQRISAAPASWQEYSSDRNAGSDRRDCCRSALAHSSVARCRD